MLEYILKEAAPLDAVEVPERLLRVQVREGLGDLNEATAQAKKRRLKEICTHFRSVLLERSTFAEIPDGDSFVACWRKEALERADGFVQRMGKPREEILLLLYGVQGDAELTEEAKRQVRFAALAEHYGAGRRADGGAVPLEQYAEDFCRQIIAPRFRDRLQVELLPAVDVSRIVDIDEDIFEREILTSAGPVVVDCYTPWCGNCKLLLPLLAELSGEMPDWRFVKMDVNACAAVGDRYQVDLVPTLLVFRGGRLLGKLLGAEDVPTLRKSLEGLMAGGKE